LSNQIKNGALAAPPSVGKSPTLNEQERNGAFLLARAGYLCNVFSSAVYW